MGRRDASEPENEKAVFQNVASRVEIPEGGRTGIIPACHKVLVYGNPCRNSIICKVTQLLYDTRVCSASDKEVPANQRRKGKVERHRVRKEAVSSRERYR